MKRARATALLRERALSSRGPIGFEVRDAAGRSSAFEIDLETGRALVFGSASPVLVRGTDVLAAHFVVLPHDGALVAASASVVNPAFLNGAALPTTWTVLEVPSRIRIGSACVDFFYVNDSGIVVVDKDHDRTVSDPGRAPPPPMRAKGPLPRPSPPPRRPSPMAGPRLVEPPTTMDPRVVDTGPQHAFVPPAPRLPGWTPTVGLVESPRTAREIFLDVAMRAQTAWSSAPLSTRVLLGVVAVLLIFLLFRGPRPA